MGLHSISVTRLFAEICGSKKTKRNMTNNDRNEIPNLYRPDRTPAISWLPLSVYGPISRHGATPQPDSPQPPSHAGKVLLIVDQRFQLHCCPLCIKRLTTPQLWHFLAGRGSLRNSFIHHPVLHRSHWIIHCKHFKFKLSPPIVHNVLIKRVPHRSIVNQIKLDQVNCAKVKYSDYK